MAKNYAKEKLADQRKEYPRKVVIDRILAFSKAYQSNPNKVSSLENLKTSLLAGFFEYGFASNCLSNNIFFKFPTPRGTVFSSIPDNL